MSRLIDYKRRVRIVFLAFFVLAAALCGNVVKLAFLDAEEIRTNSYNKRMFLAHGDVKKGSIVSLDSYMLAYTDTETDERVYPFPGLFGHVAGYTQAGGYGVERRNNFDLYKLYGEFSQRLSHLSGVSLHGGNVRLTATTGFAQYMSDAFGSRNGAVVAIEPSTGRILGMISKPFIDPYADFQSLYGDTSGTLLNKATQGLYEPGSTFKIVTALCYLEACEITGDDPYEFTFDCRGVEDFGDGDTVSCFDGAVHGEVNLEKAMEMSCNAFFAKLGERLGAEALGKTAEELLFNKTYGYPLEYSVSSFALTGESPHSELLQTAFGQGKTVTSPLHMVMIAAAVANGGVMMKPNIIDAKMDGDAIAKKIYPAVETHAFSAKHAAVLNELLKNCVSNGTGGNAKLSFPVAGKTGTAENPGKADHSWFVAYGPADEPVIAVCVFIENGGTSRQAAAIAGQIINYYVKNYCEE